MTGIDELDILLKDCGYEEIKTESDRLAVSVAKIVWRHKQHEIDTINIRICTFKEAFINL